MKQKDITTIFVAVVISIIVSFVLAKYTFGSYQTGSQTVDVVPPISSSFPDNTSKQYQQVYGPYFNNKSIDPTQLIRIGNNRNPVPFGTQ